MNRSILTCLLLCGGGVAVLGQTAPIYRVTVERKAIPAVAYGYETGATKIDFGGTVLLPRARGEAVVNCRKGAVEVDAKFERLDPPTRFGRQYLTYVIWALTPDGRPQNLGELVTNGANKARIRVSTPLRTFGIIVTAEPFYSVSRPSNLVVLENEFRPDTAGRRLEVQASPELLPRDERAGGTELVEVGKGAALNQPKVSQGRYEAVLALYEAQNALQMARAQGADREAADTLNHAEQLYRRAQQMNAEKADSRRIAMTARQATQVAEDARTIAERRNQQQ